MIFRDLTFLNPNALYLLFALIPLLALAQLLYLYRQRVITTVESPRIFYWAQVALILTAWTFATLALLEPSEHGTYPEELTQTKQKAHRVVLAIDASASMSATDTPLKQSRLELAKEAADEIVKKLPDEMIALYAFTSAPTKLVPLTPNALFLRLQLKNIAINEGAIAGTDFNPLFDQIQEDIPSSKTVILLSDGENNGATPKKPKNTQLVTIGVGSKEGQTLKGVHTSLNASLLKELGNRYLDSNEGTPLQIANSIQEILAETETTDVIEKSVPIPYSLYFQFPLALAILSLGIALLLPQKKLRF